MAEAGLFLDCRVELIEGEIVEMPPQKNFHAAAISLTQDALNAAFGPGHWVRVQMSLDLTPLSVPDPDLAVVPGSPRQVKSAQNPTTALLIVEVSETTLRFDRGRKASLYARAGIADYWIVNLVDRQLEVRRNPVSDGNQPYGFRYADEMILSPADFVTPLGAPQARISVVDLLP
jgi:Uma2 family endonuclease